MMTTKQGAPAPKAKAALPKPPEGSATMEVEHKHAGTIDEASIAVAGFEEVDNSEAVAHVGVDVSRTINTGNFNSIRVGVSIRVPCAVANVNPTFEKALLWSEARLAAKCDEICEALAMLPKSGK